MRLKISARSSHLARLQAFEVGKAIQIQVPNAEIEFFFRESLGDKNLVDPLWKMPEKGVFTEDFHNDLIEEKTDLVVHSWKDLPTERRSDTTICGTLARADQRDLLLFKKKSIEKLKSKVAVSIFSSSQRRIYNLEKFLLKALPFAPEKIFFKDVRGNIPTRIEKLFASDEVDGLILAKAALDRLLLIDHPDFKKLQIQLRQFLALAEFMVLPLSENPNAAAQGALAIEVKTTRKDLIELVQRVNHLPTFQSAQQERDILASYGGGCHQKIGIAVLKRSYGDITFLRGQTDQNEILDLQKIDLRSGHFSPPKNLKKISVSRIQGLFQRIELDFKLPATANAFYISRVTAYRAVQGVVWTSGVETWKKLAALNVWVNGCSESLGETEQTRIESLVGQPLQWAKLTHKDSDNGEMLSVATYQINMKLDLPEEALRAENFFWMSAYQFDVITKKYPALKNKIHCCGVGSTFNSLTERLAEIGQRPYLFLNEAEWRKHG